MSSFSGLEIGKRSLLAQRFGIDITSNNIANANTPGYSRVSPVITETDPTQTSSGLMGTGAFVSTIQSYREDYLDKEVRKAMSQQSGYEADQTTLQKVDAFLNEPSSSGLNEQLGNFFNAWNQAAQQPQDVSIRSALTASAQTLVESLHTIAGNLTDARNSTLDTLNKDTNQINSDLSQIANYNSSIANVTAQNNGTDSSTLVDKRELALEDLSKLANITVTQGNPGQVNVFINGINIVNGTNASKLQIQTSTNSTSGETTANLMKIDSTGNNITSVNPQTGAVASLLKSYNVTFDPQESGNGFSIAKNLNDLANSLYQKINSITSSGYGLNDTGTAPAGRNFFDSSSGTVTAASIQVSQDLIDNPQNIPLSDSPDTPGNAAIANKVANLTNDTTFLNGQTPTGYYNNFLAKIASMEQDANNGQTASQLITNQLTTQRESVIGVNMDEEATNIIKYQQAFSASSRIINTTNDLLNTIVNLGL